MVRVGGPSKDAPPGDANDRKHADEIVPMSYHSHSDEELEEFINSLNGKGVLELGALDGILPYVAVVKGTPYVGVTFTDSLKACA